jgi:hypothetical protein
VIAPALSDRCKLIKLNGHTKVAMETKWQRTNNYFPDSNRIIEHIESGQNYGIMVINNTIVIDSDCKQLYDCLPSHWKMSLTTITGKGNHIFLDCPDSPPDKIVLHDTITKVALGDVRGSESEFYTVGPGSIHPDTKKKYEWVDINASLVSVSWKEITTDLIEKYKADIKKQIPKREPTSSGPLSDKLGLRIEDFAMPDNPTKRGNGDIQGAHPIHGSSTGMNFAINPKKNVWYCYRDDVGGDPVSWIAYAHCNISETDCTRLTKEQFKCVKDWLRINGYEKQLKVIEDEHFKEDSTLPKVDITGILNPKTFNSDIDIENEIKKARERNVLPAFPTLDDGIFKEYLELGKRVSYSLEEYHFAALLSIASMAVGRKVVCQVGMTSVYPNVFVMVVGQTTISGKSVACNMAVDSFGTSITHEEPIAKCYSTNILRGTISEAALVQGLNDIYNSFWMYDDCAGFFEDVTAWNAHILGTLCSIYDGSQIERTLSKRSKTGEQSKWSCPFPYVSLLFNTTTKDIEQIASARLFSSGFFPRLMWFWGQGGQPRKNEDVSESDKQIINGIKLDLKTLRSALEAIPMDGVVFKVCNIIEEWKIKATENKLGKEDESYRTAASRAFIHAYKIAAILAIFDKSFQKTTLSSLVYPISVSIPDKHAKMAIKIVEQYLIPRTMFVYELCNSSDAKNHQVMVMKALNHFGGVSERSKILRQTHLGKRDLDLALSTLLESGEIKCHCETTQGAKKPTMIVIKQ